MKLMRGTARLLPLVLLTVSGVSACQSDNGEEKASPSKTSESTCSGSLNRSAVNAVASLVGSDTYRTSSPPDGAVGAAKDIVSEYRTNGITKRNKVGLCWIYRSEKDLSDLTISFSFVTEVPQSNKVASTFTPYDMGALALAESQRAAIYMKCSSTRFESDGSRETFTLRGETSNRYLPDGSPKELQKNNLIIMHSASLSLARALNCQDNAGIPTEFKMLAKA